MASLTSDFDFNNRTNSQLDEVKTLFKTREGLYKLMKLSEYSRPSRYSPGDASTIPVRLAFISVRDPFGGCINDVISFNIAKELYVYYYNGIKKAADLTKPIERKSYKGPSPTCHDFNALTAKHDYLTILVGFTHGQIQMVELMAKECVKLFNEERLIDSTKVTCIRWVPQLPNQFLVAHSSGHMYLYDDQLPCNPVTPTYDVLIQGSGFAVDACNGKNVRNPLYRWRIDNSGAVHEFAFSPCSRYLAVVSADGYLRIFNYHRMELVGWMRSYFGGLRCIAWSPNGRYVATGGEDDMLTIYSFLENRIVCRGVSHKSWINGIAFDRYMSTGDACSLSSSENGDSLQPTLSAIDDLSDAVATTYRLGTVGDDTLFCLWELTEDMLACRPACSCVTSISNTSTSDQSYLVMNGTVSSNSSNDSVHRQSSGIASSISTEVTVASQSLSSFHISEECLHHDHRLSVGSNHISSNTLHSSIANGISQRFDCQQACSLTLGSMAYPKLKDIPMLEPLVCKKIANDRLTAVAFHEDCIVVACQDGTVCTWSRPGRMITSQVCSSKPNLMFSRDCLDNVVGSDHSG